ncbi:hypothetical protein [Actinomyces sp.]|uniref:hypothetical protein n=1 Tax=Actinomyces sp. TaxID=29317 RepID=UPI0026DBC70C|nr:hypothetical protein [Actinomyces sp.]MDO4900858.1 hypothetical protein [Actinomyces sp.]
MKKHVSAVFANMAGVLLAVLSLTLLEGAGELFAEVGAVLPTTLLLLSLAVLVGVLSLGLLLGPGRSRRTSPRVPDVRGTWCAPHGVGPGREPPTAATGLQWRHAARREVPPVGLEPTTFGLKGP